MLITRVYTGSDGKSHFEDVEIELLDKGPMGSISSLWSAKGVLFRKVSGDYDLDFHNAPRRQFVVNLTGAVEIEVGDGTKRQLGAEAFYWQKIPKDRVTSAAVSMVNPGMFVYSLV